MSESKSKNGNGKKWILISVGGLVAVMLVVSACQKPEQPKPVSEKPKPSAPPTKETESKTSAEPLAERVASLLKEAREVHHAKKWSDAVAKWELLLAAIPKDSKDANHFLIEELEAHRNLAIAKQSVKALKTALKVGESLEVPEPADADKPVKLSEDDLIAWYPQGRTVRSVGLLHVHGKGSHRDWGLKGLANFEYIYQVVSEAKITANNAQTGRLTFEQSFLDVTQMRAVSQKSLELDLPDSLLVTIAWKQLEKYLPAEWIPGYGILKRLHQLSEIVDPRLKNTLTLLQKWLSLADSGDVELAVMLDRLAGAKVRIEYVSGIGVVSIAPISGVELSRDELMQLAHASTLLMDYFIFPAANKPIGEQWTVRAADVGNMTLPTMSGTKLDGSITISRDEDVRGKDDSDLAHLKIVSGRIQLRSDDEYKDQQGHVTVESGTARFSLRDKIVRDARLKFQSNLDIKSKNHLLFGTESMRDVHVDSRYEAELIKPSESK